MLIDSLEKDGRFYGAEWKESIKFPWMECKKCGGYFRTEEQMKIHSEQNTGHDNFESTSVANMAYRPVFIGRYPI